MYKWIINQAGAGTGANLRHDWDGGHLEYIKTKLHTARIFA